MNVEQAGDGSIEMGGDELPRDSKVSEKEATRGSVVKGVEAGSEKKGNEAVCALKVGSNEKESMYDSLETQFQQTGWKGDDDGSEVADGLKEERIKATDNPKKKGDADIGQNAGGLKVKEHEAAGGSMKQKDGSNEKGDDCGKAAGDTKEKDDIADVQTEDEADLKEKRDKSIGSKKKGDEDVGQDTGGLEEGEHEAAGRSRVSSKAKRDDSGHAAGGTKEKGDEDGGQTGGGVKRNGDEDDGEAASGLGEKEDIADVGLNETEDEADLKEKSDKTIDGSKKKDEDVSQDTSGWEKGEQAASGSMKQRDSSKEKGDEVGGHTGGGVKRKGDKDGGKAASDLGEKEYIADVGLNETEDEADLKEKSDKSIDGSKKKGDEDVGQDTGGLEEGEQAASGSIKQIDSSKEKRGDSGHAAGGTKEKGDEDGGQIGGSLKGKAHKDGGGSARGLTKKGDVAAVESKKVGDEAVGGLKKGNQSDCGSNEKGDGCGRDSKKVHESVGTSKEKNQSSHSLKEKGDQVAGGSKKKGNEAAVGSKKKKEQAESAENTMVVILHAFIQPDAWGIDSKDLQHAVHVHSDHLQWKQNCAKVNVR